ncbi:hypothetical protein [Beduini massiliensis]|uniref:hypothetical protein n=1 Tax=Beduini massiliensis TaxID=1585974 RepID=UPI00059A9F94|nr:hypothetical protein [Beduini massiliensis]
MSSYREKLIQTVLDNSVSNYWDSAVQEWEIVDCEEDEKCKSACICGKERLRYLYTIRNYETGSTLYPIGSSCIKKFNRDDLNEQTTVNEKLFQLLHAIQNRQFISLNSEFFSRKLLRYLYDEGVFKPTQYNKFNGENDYEFLLDMFNKRSEPSERQEAKIRAIIVSSIRPYLVQRLRNKIIH